MSAAGPVGANHKEVICNPLGRAISKNARFERAFFMDKLLFEALIYWGFGVWLSCK